MRITEHPILMFGAAAEQFFWLFGLLLLSYLPWFCDYEKFSKSTTSFIQTVIKALTILIVIKFFSGKLYT